MADTVREQCQRRLSGLQAARSPYEPEWDEIARLGMEMPPSTLAARPVTGQKKRRTNPKLTDGHAIRSFRILGSGMHSGLSSPSRPWFKLTLSDRELMADQGVKEWLAVVEDQIYAFLASTNFYTVSQTGYHQLGLFGVEAALMEEHPIYGAVCHPMMIGEYWVAESDGRMCDTLYRAVPMTVRQVVQKFGSAKASQRVRDQYDRSNYDVIVDVFHAIEPNPEQDINAVGSRGKPLRSIYWDSQDDVSRTLRESGYHRSAFWAPRWETYGADAYGSSPGFTALPDMREMQFGARRKAQVIDFLVNPELVAPASVKLKRQPGSVVTAAAIDADKVKVPYQMPYQAVEAVRDDVLECRRAVDAASYADLFNAITNMPGIQPKNVEEIASRNEEKLTQLGPVIERVGREKLQVVIDRSFDILWRANKLPPPPDQLQGMEIKTEFVSILAQMQRMIGLGQMERSVGFVGNMVAAFPEVADLVDADATVREYFDRAGTPPKTLRSPEDVAGIRQQRAQQQKMQQAAAMMPAVKDGADAAQLLSQTDVGGGESLLQRMAGS